MIRIVSLCVLLAVVGAQVCLPHQFSWKRQGDFKAHHLGFDHTEEHYDYINKNMRYVQSIFEPSTNQEMFFDNLLIGSQKKLYTLSGVKGSGSITCKTSAATFPAQQPCLLANATLQGHFLFAGDVLTACYQDNGWTNNTGSWYQEVCLTAGTNIPISSRQFIQNFGGSAELYYDFTTILAPGTFSVPFICTQATEATPAETAQYLSMLKSF